MKSPSLIDRVGGPAALGAAVEIFYKKVIADERVNGFFRGVDMARQHSMMTSYLAYALGSPIKFTGRDLTNTHARLVEMGLNDAHFDAVAENLISTLKELRVPENVIEETLAIVAGKRDDVFGRRMFDAALASSTELRRVNSSSA